MICSVRESDLKVKALEIFRVAVKVQLYFFFVKLTWPTPTFSFNFKRSTVIQRLPMIIIDDVVHSPSQCVSHCAVDADMPSSWCLTRELTPREICVIGTPQTCLTCFFYESARERETDRESDTKYLAQLQN